MDIGQRQGPGRRPSGRPGDPLQPTTVSKGFPTTVAEAGLPRLRFHDLGHSSASFMLHMGSRRWRSLILGHSYVTTTLMIYVHAIEDQTSPKAAQVMNVHFGQQHSLHCMMSRRPR
jgi:integrase